jgi:hypothetical protein
VARQSKLDEVIDMTSASQATPAWRRLTAWTVLAAMLLPSLLACAPAPYAPPAPTSAPPPAPPMAAARVPAEVARLDGIVVDGVRLASAREGGWVVVVRDGVRQEAHAGMSLHVGDRVETGPRADAVLRYPTGTEVIMRPQSGGRIGSLTDVIGEVFVKVRGLFSVDTTFVRAGARGTSYLVRSFPGGATSIVVFEGAVEVDSTTGAWAPVILGPGTMALAHPRAPQPMAASTEELARTRDWVEHVASLEPQPGSGVSRTGVVAGVAIAAALAAILASRSHESGPRPPDHAHDTPPPRDTPPAPTPPPPRPLEPPHAIEPGTAQAPGPQLDCRRGVMLRWSAVAGARDYVVAFEAQPERRGWTALRVAPTAATQARVSPEQGLAYANRWSVRARGASDGPPSQTFHFQCDFTGVR